MLCRRRRLSSLKFVIILSQRRLWCPLRPPLLVSEQLQKAFLNPDPSQRQNASGFTLLSRSLLLLDQANLQAPVPLLSQTSWRNIKKLCLELVYTADTQRHPRSCSSTRLSELPWCCNMFQFVWFARSFPSSFSCPLMHGLPRCSTSLSAPMPCFNSICCRHTIPSFHFPLHIVVMFMRFIALIPYVYLDHKLVSFHHLNVHTSLLVSLPFIPSLYLVFSIARIYL